MSSRLEWLAREYMKYYFPNEEVIYNWRPDFLRNPETGKNFEIDIYYPFLRMGVEVNSIFHKTRQNKNRDRFKRDQCKKEGVVLFQIWNKRHLLSLRYELQKHFPNDVRLLEKLPQNEYLMIIQYAPQNTRGGYIVGQKIRYEQGADAQSKELAGLEKRRKIRAGI